MTIDFLRKTEAITLGEIFLEFQKIQTRGRRTTGTQSYPVFHADSEFRICRPSKRVLIEKIRLLDLLNRMS